LLSFSFSFAFFLLCFVFVSPSGEGMSLEAKSRHGKYPLLWSKIFTPPDPITLLSLLSLGSEMTLLVQFIRGILDQIETEQNLEHYQMAFVDPPFHVGIGVPRHMSPTRNEKCLSCCENPISLISQLDFPSSFHNVWLDAKARPMLVITPRRHIERLSEMSDQELSNFFLTIARVLSSLGYGQPGSKVSYQRMVLNHGNARNLKHLHLKISFKKDVWGEIQQGWDEKTWGKWIELRNGDTYRTWRRTQALYWANLALYYWVMISRGGQFMVVNSISPSNGVVFPLKSNHLSATRPSRKNTLVNSFYPSAKRGLVLVGSKGA